MAKLAALLLSLVQGQVFTIAGEERHCKQHTVDFIMLSGDATMLAIEDDIRAHLEMVGIEVNLRLLEKEDFNTAMTSGDFNLAFSETWGPPYDPHSYAASWAAPDEAYFAALKGLPAPNDYDTLMAKIDAVHNIVDEQDRAAAWKEIFQVLHDTATELPFSGKRIPAIVSNRLTGYKNGLQQFDYPMHTLSVADSSDSKTITVAPGGQTGLFVGVGRLDPHSYRPNEFFANNFVYDGLVEYGEDGTILPSLAKAWTVEDLSAGGQKYTFHLREGVTFHDGADWDCDAAKLNFDHVLVKPLTTGDWHGWYNLVEQINGWSCASTYVFEVTTKDKYYPLLQELTYIRPLRMLSPTMFVGSAASDPVTQNSCPTGWGWAELDGVNVTCAGTTGISGTGRWVYDSTEEDGDGNVEAVVFTRNADHWDSSPSDPVETMRLVVYADHAAVKAALMDGSLDVVVGEGVLDPEDVEEIMTDHTDKFTVHLTAALQNRMIIFNTAKAPTDDLQLRKVIIHSVDKEAIIQKELYGLAESVDGLFPKTAPYCHFDLTPRLAYDPEKAQLLICPEVAAESKSSAVEQAKEDGEAAVAAAKEEGAAAVAKAEKEGAAAVEDAKKEGAAAVEEAQKAKDAAVKKAEEEKSDGKKALDAALARAEAAEKKLADAGSELSGILGLIIALAARY